MFEDLFLNRSIREQDDTAFTSRVETYNDARPTWGYKGTLLNGRSDATTTAAYILLGLGAPGASATVPSEVSRDTVLAIERSLSEGEICA